jgi:hypothetical protein
LTKTAWSDTFNLIYHLILRIYQRNHSMNYTNRFAATGIANLAIIALSSIILISLQTGCASPYPENPVQVVIEHHKALMQGDAKKMESYTSAKAKMTRKANTSPKSIKARELIANIPKGVEFQKQNYWSAEEKKWWEEQSKKMESPDSYDFSMDGSTARVWLKTQPNMVFVLVRERGKWKLDDSEMDLTGIIKDKTMKDSGKMSDQEGVGE